MDFATLPIEARFVQALERRQRLPERNAARNAALLGAFLASDFHVTATGSLPRDVKGWSNRILSGRYLLQIDEIVNIGVALKARFEEKGKGRTLKFHLTDGRQQIVGLEYRHIEALKVNSPAGMKILVTDVFVHRGVLMLCPENVQIVGGSVERLKTAQAATRAALTKVTVKGNRARKTEDLYEEAELAAWDFENEENRLPQPPSIQRSSTEPLDTHEPQMRAPAVPVYNPRPAPGPPRISPRPKPTSQPMTRSLATPDRGASNQVTQRRMEALETVDLVHCGAVTPPPSAAPVLRHSLSLVHSRPPSKAEFDVIDLLGDE